MPAITVQDLNNAKVDVDHIAAVATSTAPTATDRLGHTKLTMQGAVDTIKSFNPRGARVDGTTYVLKDIYTEGGIAYVTVVASFASTSVAADLAAGHVAVYQGLTSEDLEASKINYLASDVNAVPMSVEDRLRERISIPGYGAKGDGVTSDTPSLILALLDTDHIHCPRINGEDTTYFFSAFPSGTLDGVTISTDTGVVLSFAESQYGLYNKALFSTDVRVIFRDIGSSYEFVESPPKYKKTSVTLTPPALRRRQIALDCTDTTQVNLRGVTWPTSDTFSAATGTTATNIVTLNAASGKFQGPFVEIGAYETVSAYFENGFVGAIGVIIRGRLGFSIIYTSNATDDLTAATKLFDQTISNNSPNLPWAELGQGRYDSFAADKSIWSVSKVDAARVIVKLNGRAVTVPYAPEVGDVFEIGFVCFGASFSVTGLTLSRRTDANMGMQKLDSLSIWGDSTAEGFPSSWDKYMKGILDGMYGVKLGSVTNNAISGQSISQQFALMQSLGFGTAYYVVVCIGTNDIQGLTGIIAWRDAVTDMIELIQSSGRKAVLVTPWMWYTQDQSGGVGQASSNYDLGARYRMVMERVAFEKGAIIVNSNEEFPNPDPQLLIDEPQAPLLRDNIHQDSTAHQLYASAIAKAIIDDYVSSPDTIEEIPAAALMLSGATADPDLRMTYSKDGVGSVNGSITLNGVEAGGVLMRIPRYMAPTRTTSILGAALSDTALLGVARVFLSPSSGAMQLADHPTGMTRILISGGSWKTADSA